MLAEVETAATLLSVTDQGPVDAADVQRSLTACWSGRDDAGFNTETLATSLRVSAQTLCFRLSAVTGP